MLRADLIDSSQFTSVVLHELGHVLGLDHSCDSKGDSGSFLGCSSANVSPEYVDAVMYPSLSVGKIKDQLQPNDTARASCLY
jgi:hypothetical protein